MGQIESALRRIPKMDTLLEQPQVSRLSEQYSRPLVTEALRCVLERLREDLRQGKRQDFTLEELIAQCEEQLQADDGLKQKIVINATGVLLHTNLGRALLAQEAAEAVKEAALHYTTLEMDCTTGKRGDRYQAVENQLKELLGVEAALVVNNNAAAVMLALSSLAAGREVIVSRGELVEIGGSFRVPEVMEQSGCILREVGATNKTHPQDYQKAIGENTAALLKVHTSNYRIVGFTQEVALGELVQIGRENNLPVMHDLGSGAMLPLEPYGIQNEPTVAESVRAGADVICFSGDKLLGGPQAGIIVGKKAYLEPMKRHPLLRALRVDKLILTALEATLRLYRDNALAEKRLPLYQMLSTPLGMLEQRARRLLNHIQTQENIWAEIVESQGQVGGGSVPTESIPSIALRLQVKGKGAEQIQRDLFNGDVPIVARVHKECILLDMRTITDAQVEVVGKALVALTAKF